MKKILGIKFGGLREKTVRLMLIMLAVAIAVFAGVTAYQSGMLARIVGQTRTEQQQAISSISESTMHQILEGSLVSSTELRARIADNDFAEVVNNVSTLREMAQDLFANRENLAPAEVRLPDAALDGTVSAMVLCEAGVDHTRSEYLGVAAHMSGAMVAMCRSSDKIDGCYIGLADGVDLCVDDKAGNKLDSSGNPIPFPVRERPWYRGAAQSGGLFFTGIISDAFSGKLMVTCSAPVYDGQTLVGVVGIDIILESMSDFVQAAAGSGVHVYIVNDLGQVILASDSEGPFRAELSEEASDIRSGGGELSQFISGAYENTTALTELAVGGTAYYLVGSPMQTIGWTLICAIEKEITDQPELQMLSEYDKINEDASAQFRAGTVRTNRTAAMIIAAVLLLGAAAALFAAKKIADPIEEMTRTIVRSSQTGRPFVMEDCYRTGDEIEILASSFDDLSRKTKQYIEDITRITREKERVSTELHMANQIQEGMLPNIYPAFPDRTEFDIYATMDPAREVGGDFYDFFLIDDDHLCLLIADVSGKGVPAALFMMASKIILANNAMMGKSPAKILEDTNAAICSNNRMEMFVTVWLGILEISTGKLTAANAGHEYPVFMRPGGPYERLKDKHGFVVGGMSGVRYREYELRLEPGARVFLYTDGVTEANNAQNELFGMDRMVRALNEVEDASPKEVLEHVADAVDGFVEDAEQFDDVTMLCLAYYGPEKTEGKA